MNRHNVLTPSLFLLVACANNPGATLSNDQTGTSTTSGTPITGTDSEDNPTTTATHDPHGTGGDQGGNTSSTHTTVDGSSSGTTTTFTDSGSSTVSEEGTTWVDPCDACGPNTLCEELVDGTTACTPLICSPNQQICHDSGSTQTCNEKGTEWSISPCLPTELCNVPTGTCKDACEVVAQLDSSLGCEFYAVDMPNLPPRDDFVFAAVLSNPSSKAEAHIEIFDQNGGSEQLVASGTIESLNVNVFPLSGTSNGDQGFYPDDAGFLGTGIAKGRAFRIASDIPIVATQFNPLGGANAFTTDASLLLPTHTLSDSYYHLAWDRGSGSGSTMIIVATTDDTVLTITSPVNTAAGMNGMPAMTAGVPQILPPLKRYDYVQVSAPGKDLSGAKITATADVAVFGGHSCGRVPDLQAGGCDHLEEQIFPLNTWGEHYIAARAPQRGTEPMIWRIMAAENDTIIEFEPEISLGDSYQLDAGELVEFTAGVDFELNTNTGHPVMVAGYLYGCEAVEAMEACPGDPSMVLLVPVEQWLANYMFLVDFNYTNNNVKLVRKAGEEVQLGCLSAPVEGWTPITPNYEAAVVNFNGNNGCNPGTNSAAGSAPFGIMVVGEAENTSYAYPGGLQLEPINPQ